MIRYTSIAELCLVGGHPALDLANTVVARQDRWGPDLLVDYQDLLDWSVAADVLGPERAQKLADVKKADWTMAQAALRRAKHLREAIYTVFSSQIAGRRIPPKALATLKKASVNARKGSVLHPESGRIIWRASDEADLDSITHCVVECAVELLSQPDKLQRVHECPGQNCGWLFLDKSKAGRRKWCSEEDCGTLARVRRHRSRKAAEKGSRKGKD